MRGKLRDGMATILSSDGGSGPHKTLAEVRPAMAKASHNNLVEDWRLTVGKAVRRAFELAGVSQKEAAALLDRDEPQIAKWISGVERPQFDRLLTVVRLRVPVLVALAEAAGEDVEVSTTIRIVRRA